MCRFTLAWVVCIAWPGSCCWTSRITCGLSYMPLLASVANVLACSSTVSEAWPRAVPTSLRWVYRPEAAVSTPNDFAMLTMFWPSVPATRW